MVLLEFTGIGLGVLVLALLVGVGVQALRGELRNEGAPGVAVAGFVVLCVLVTALGLGTMLWVLHLLVRS